MSNISYFTFRRVSMNTHDFKKFDKFNLLKFSIVRLDDYIRLFRYPENRKYYIGKCYSSNNCRDKNVPLDIQYAFKFQDIIQYYNAKVASRINRRIYEEHLIRVPEILKVEYVYKDNSETVIAHSLQKVSFNDLTEILNEP